MRKIFHNYHYYYFITPPLLAALKRQLIPAQRAEPHQSIDLRAEYKCGPVRREGKPPNSYVNRTQQPIRQQFNASDFVFKLNGLRLETNGLGGQIRAVNLEHFPALQGRGVF